MSEVFGAQIAAQKMKEDAVEKIKDLRREMELARSEATSWQVRFETGQHNSTTSISAILLNEAKSP